MNLSENRFLAGWTILTTLGLALGVIAALLLGGPIEAVVGMMLVTPVVTSLVGLVLGCSQWPHIRSLLDRPGLWILASGAGVGVGLASGVVMVEQVGRLLAGHAVNVGQLGPSARALSLAGIGIVTGLSVGLAEGLVLRRESVKVASFGVTTVIAFGAGFPISSLLVDFFLGGVTSPLGVVVFVVVAGLILGAVTARPLQRAVRAAS